MGEGALPRVLGGSAWTIATRVPSETIPNSSASSSSVIRMQPWDALKPMEPRSEVAWMRIPGALRARALVPRGLLGPGPILAGMLFAQALPGLIQVGFTIFCTTRHVPVGVGKPAAPVATGHQAESSRNPDEVYAELATLDDGDERERPLLLDDGNQAPAEQTAAMAVGDDAGEDDDPQRRSVGGRVVLWLLGVLFMVAGIAAGLYLGLTLLR